MNYLNGVQRNKAHPDTFYVPHPEEKANIRPGQHIKVGAEFPDKPYLRVTCERFWVKVTEVDVAAGTIKALVSNDLVYTECHGLKCDDLIEVSFDHVLDIL